MAGTVLIIAYHPASLTLIFGETALCRLARLAASLAEKVQLWMTPEIYQDMGREFQRLPAHIFRQVLPAEEMVNAARHWSSSPVEEVLVLPGHSVWDRLSLNKAVHSVTGEEINETWKSLVPASEMAALVHRWLGGGGLLSTPAVDLLPFLLRGKADAATAEDRLVEHLAAATQASDGLMARLVDRRLSRRISPSLARRRVPPNAITLFSMSIGFLGAWLLAQVGYAHHLMGALLFLTAVVLDGVDGEVARLTLMESRFGHYLDIITDNLVHVAVFIGIAVGIYRQTQNTSHLYALAIMLVGFGLCVLAVYQVEKGDRLPGTWTPVASRLVGTLNSRDFAYLVVFLALIDRLSWFLWAAAVGTYIFAASLWLLPVYYRRKSTGIGQ